MSERIILSIDIGVKNLAFCLMSPKDSFSDGDNFNIYDWQSVNLIDEEYPLCETPMKSGKQKGKICGKPSKIKTDDDIYYCASHNPDKERYTAREATKVKTVLLKDTCLALYTVLESLPQLISRPCEVVIEQQMKANPTMLQMAHLVYSYFIMKGYVVDASPIKNVRFISARNKLTVYEGPEIQCHLKNAYGRRKWFAVEYTKYMIRNNTTHLDFFNKFPKKRDDLSDCYLQGVWWLTKNGSVTRSGTNKKPRKKIKNTSSNQNKQTVKWPITSKLTKKIQTVPE